jgi:hypothetical protein
MTTVKNRGINLTGGEYTQITIDGVPYPASLIDAAPDMLEALRELLACCEAHPAFSKPTNTITQARVRAARAAIARAEGKP